MPPTGFQEAVVLGFLLPSVAYTLNVLVWLYVYGVEPVICLGVLAVSLTCAAFLYGRKLASLHRLDPMKFAAALVAQQDVGGML